MNRAYLPRHIEGELERLSRLFAVIVVTGPRQSGKTTLCKVKFPKYRYVNLEDLSTRELILSSPKSFLEQHRSGLIIDEVQNAPEILSYVQLTADENEDCHFVLTSSNNFALMQGITQSLAGRAAVLTLLPLSLNELNERSRTENTDMLLFNGGYPAVWSKKIPVQDVSRQYYNTYIERDVRQLLKVKDLSRFQTFVKLCAGRVGTELNASALSNDTGISVPTIQDWLSVLEASYILFRLPPFFKNVGKRLVKSPKIYFYDTGLVCFLLGIENTGQVATHPLRGAIFENMVILEFLKTRFNQGKTPQITFYRDKSQREIDVIEEHGNTVFAYEIKASQRFNRDFFTNLDYLRKIAGEYVASTQVIYDGDEELFREENGILNVRSLPELLR